MSEDKKSKSKIPAILLGVAIALAILAFLVKSLPCIPIPVPAGQPDPVGDPAKVEAPKKADPPVQPVDPTTGGLTIDKPDLGIVAPPLK